LDGPALCTAGNPGCSVTLDNTCGGFVCLSNVDCAYPDKCLIGTCLAGVCDFELKQCDDGNVMTLDYCDPKSGLCVNKAVSQPFTQCDDSDPEAADCNDDDFCTNDGCMDGTCWYQLVNCNDFDPCSTDSCAVDQGCVFTPIAGCKGCQIDSDCDDGDACTTDLCGKEGAAPFQCKSIIYDPPPGDPFPVECL